MKPTPTKDMLNAFGTVAGLSSIEKVLEDLKLPDGRIAQVTAKIETDEAKFVPPGTRTSIDHRNHCVVTTDGTTRLTIPLSKPTTEDGNPEVTIAED